MKAHCLRKGTICASFLLTIIIKESYLLKVKGLCAKLRKFFVKLRKFFVIVRKFFVKLRKFFVRKFLLKTYGVFVFTLLLLNLFRLLLADFDSSTAACLSSPNGRISIFFP